MKKRIISVFILAFVCLVEPIRSLPVFAQQQPAAAVQNQPNTDEDVEETAPGEIVIDGNPVLTVYEPVGTLTVDARAAAIEQRIVEFARHGDVPADSIYLQQRESWTEIHADNMMIMAVSGGDAKAAGKPRQLLAQEYAQNIQKAVETYRHDHSWRIIFRGILKALLTTAILVVFLWIVRRLRVIFRSRVERQIHASSRHEKRSAWHTLVGYLGPAILTVGTFFRWILILALIEIYLTVTLGFFSTTREVSLTATRWVLSQLELLATSGVDYLPNLLVIAVIVLVVIYALRLIHLVFSLIAKGDLNIRGFYPDWAEPTDKLVRLLFLVLALIVAFPYLPGAKSPAFQGISIFVGVLLSLGSSSAVANAIAGVILTYMRSFLVGDWIQIGDTMGEVVERTLLVTRLLTPKAEIITIPNSTVMSGAVKNYSTEAKKSGVIFYTTVTIGYDAPWRTVHQLLISAALETAHVLREPGPFVLQRALNDFYVSYELNAYTNAPREVLNIYSDLHRNIQDKFNEAGVEICSPHFSALRDANAAAMPEQYVKPGFKETAFRVNLNEAANNSGNPAGQSTKTTAG